MNCFSQQIIFFYSTVFFFLSHFFTLSNQFFLSFSEIFLIICVCIYLHTFFYVCVHAKSGFPGSSSGKESPVMQETPVQFLGWEDSSGEGIGYPRQYSWVSLMALGSPALAGEFFTTCASWERQFLHLGPVIEEVIDFMLKIIYITRERRRTELWNLEAKEKKKGKEA